jgi:hypothetical protein
MGKIFNSKPAKFPDTTTEEMNSVFKLLDLLDKSRIKPDPKLIDKFPNTDGEITIVDAEQYPIGKCEIQIKTLPDSDILIPKFQCELPFLSYCETSLLPVILIVVNAKNEKAFWKHLDRDTLTELGAKIKKKSIVLHIPIANIISRTDDLYLEEWVKIINSYIQKKIAADVQEDYEKKYKELREIVANFPKPVHTVGKDNLKLLNIFIDTFNNALDGDFKSIKEVVFHSYWKISITYIIFTDSSLSFAIIPIKYGDNDLLLREMNSMTPIIRDRMARNVISYYQENPIKDRPVEFAFSLIKKETLEVIEKKHLQLLCNQLVFEYLTDFYDYAKSIFPIEFFGNIDVNKFFEIINSYLPIWVEEYHLFNKIQVKGSTLFLDIENIFWHTFEKDIKTITAKATLRFNENKLCNYNVSYGQDNSIYPSKPEFTINHVIECLEFLKNQKVHNFERPFPSKIYDDSFKFVWNWYTPETAFEKLKFIYNELPIVYDLFIESYFSKLDSSLKYYSNFDLMIVNVKYNLSYNSSLDSPGVEIFYLKSTENHTPQTKLYLNSKGCPLDTRDFSEYYKNGVELDGVSYKMISCSWGVIDFLYDRLSLEKYLYKCLKERFEMFFKSLTKEKI